MGSSSSHRLLTPETSSKVSWTWFQANVVVAVVVIVVALVVVVVGDGGGGVIFVVVTDFTFVVAPLLLRNSGCMRPTCPTPRNASAVSQPLLPPTHLTVYPIHPQGSHEDLCLSWRESGESWRTASLSRSTRGLSP